MTEQENILAGFKRVVQLMKQRTGSLTSLTTTSKGDLVGAINEINAKTNSSASINDTITGLVTTYSSYKINNLLTSTVSKNESYTDPSWIVSLPATKITGLTPSSLGLSNLVNSLQVINSGGLNSISANLLSNRPSTNSSGRLFYSIDTGSLFFDNGTSWDIVGEAEINVKNYGAKGDGVTDDTQAFQNSLNRALSTKKKVVTVPFGNYVISNTITIPQGVILQGCLNKPTYKSVQNADIDSINLIIKTPQDVNVPVFILLYNAGIRNFTFYWPLQLKTNTSAIPYGWAITTNGLSSNGDGILIENIMFTNCYNGINVDYGGQWNIRNIQGQTLNIGINIDRVFDKSNLNDIHFWTYWALTTDPIYQYIQQNAVGILIGRADLVQGSNFFGYGLKHLFKFIYSNHDGTNVLESGRPWVQFTNISFDICIVGIQIDASYFIQLSNIQGTAINRTTGRGLIETGQDVAGDVSINSVQGWNAFHIVKIKSNTGKFHITDLTKQMRGDFNDALGYALLHEGTAMVTLDKADYLDVSGSIQLGTSIQWPSDIDITTATTGFANLLSWNIVSSRVSAITNGFRFDLNGAVSTNRYAIPDSLFNGKGLYVLECDIVVNNPQNLGSGAQFYMRLGDGGNVNDLIFPSSPTSPFYLTKTHLKIPLIIRKSGMFFDFIFGTSFGNSTVDLTNIKLYQTSDINTNQTTLDWLHLKQANTLLSPPVIKGARSIMSANNNITVIPDLTELLYTVVGNGVTVTITLDTTKWKSNKPIYINRYDVNQTGIIKVKPTSGQIQNNLNTFAGDTYTFASDTNSVLFFYDGANTHTIKIN